MKEQLIEKSNIADSPELTELDINKSSYLLCVKDDKLHKVGIDNVENKFFKQFITQLRVYNNKLLKSLDLGKTWEDISDNIAAWFRWKDNRIQISRDNQLTWENLSDEFLDNLRIQDYVETVDKLPTNASLGSIYMVGPDSKGKYRLHVNSSTGWIDNGEFAGLSVGVVQKLGQSITEVPSQKLLSDELENIYNSVQVITEEEYNNLEIKDPSIFYFTYEED